MRKQEDKITAARQETYDDCIRLILELAEKPDELPINSQSAMITLGFVAGKLTLRKEELT